MPSEFLIVAEQVLRREKRPMKPKEIVAVAIRQGLFSDKRAGKTPHQTMKSKLSVDVRRKGDDSIFVRTEPGQFYLRSMLAPEQTPYEAVPIRKPSSDEKVLVFPALWLDHRRRFQGVTKYWKKLSRELLREDVCFYMDRRYAETIETHKQILTYIMVTHENKVLAYRRGSYNRTEDFLRGSDCIGFGGHVTDVDRNLFGLGDMGVRQNAIRELSEELQLPEVDRNRLFHGEGLKCVGVLNDDSSVAGQRHMAFLFQYEVSSDPYWTNPARGEKSITQLRWIGAESTIPIWQFEYWSQLCLREFFPPLVETASAYRVVRRRPLNPPHLLCVLGAVGSGKSETTRLLCSEYGYREVNTGKIMATLLGVPPVPTSTREEFQEKAWRFINKKGGPKRLAEAILDEVKELASDRVLIDGVRQKATLDSLVQMAGGVRVGVLYVHTLPDLAYQFYKERERTESTIFDFLKVRNAKVEEEIDYMLGDADAILYNWTGKRAYQKIVREMLGSVQKKE